MSAAARMKKNSTPPRLDRMHFETSRSLDFLSRPDASEFQFWSPCDRLFPTKENAIHDNRIIDGKFDH